MTSDSRRAHGGRGAAFGVALGLGLAWLLVEVGYAVAESRTVDTADALRMFASALPWQLAFFGLLGLPVAAAALRPAWAGSVVLAAASLVLFLARVGEGLLKRAAIGPGLKAAWLAAAVGVALLPVAALGLRRLLPTRWRPALAPAVWTAWVLLFVPALQRGAPVLGFAVVPPVSALFHATEVLFAAAAAGTVLAIGAVPRIWPLALVLAAVPGLGLLRGSGAPTAGSSGAGRPNVVLVVVDTLRADHLLDEPAADLAPELEAFLADSFRFRRAYSPGNRTLAAMPGVMTSLPATSVGERVSPDAETLAEYLQAAGYATAGVSANPLVSRRTGYDQGFDHLSDSFDWPSYEVGDLRRVLGVLLPGPAYRLGIASSEFYYRPASDIRRRAVKLLGGAGRPAFLYLHTMDMHGPYLPPRGLLGGDYRDRDFLSYFTFIREPRARLLAPDDVLAAEIANLRQRYAGELRLTDRELGRFFASLREQGLYDDSLIWLLADHGESFGERGYAGHGGTNTTPSVLRVPLALKPPRSWGLSPRVVDTVVSTFDVVPTTLSLLGLPPPRLAAGADLTPLLRGGAVHREHPVVSQGSGHGFRVLVGIDGSWQLDLFLARDGSVERRALYNLETDPEQHVDLARAEPGEVARLEATLRRFERFERRARVATLRGELDPRTLEQLRRLGYVE